MLVCDTGYRPLTGRRARQEEVAGCRRRCTPTSATETPPPPCNFSKRASGSPLAPAGTTPTARSSTPEAALGDGAMMLGTAEQATAPLEGSSVGQGIYVYVEDVDASFERACASGARLQVCLLPKTPNRLPAVPTAVPTTVTRSRWEACWRSKGGTLSIRSATGPGGHC